MQVSTEEYNKIGYNLQKLHEVFYKFWKVGKPIFSDILPTCAIGYDKEGDFIAFIFNPDFWNKLDNYERSFVIAHECLHVILDHGKRNEHNKDDILKNKLLNIAKDVVVNQILVDNYFMYKTKNLSEGIFLETLTEAGIAAEKGKSFEYYYMLLKDFSDKISDMPDYNHDYLSEYFDVESNQENGKSNNGTSKKKSKSLNDKILERALGIKENDIQNIKNTVDELSKKGGTESVNKIFDVVNIPIKKVYNYENLFAKIVKAKRGKFYAEYRKNDWTKRNRRFSIMDGRILLPNDIKEVPKDKIEMWFFQDISGSCVYLKDKFISIARNIPTKIFDIRYHTFDTEVKEVNIYTDKICGGGGTDFQCIEQYVLQKSQQEGGRYPEIIFVITDGCSSNIVKPKMPRNWHWLLSENNTTCFSKECNHVLLHD